MRNTTSHPQGRRHSKRLPGIPSRHLPSCRLRARPLRSSPIRRRWWSSPSSISHPSRRSNDSLPSCRPPPPNTSLPLSQCRGRTGITGRPGYLCCIPSTLGQGKAWAAGSSSPRPSTFSIRCHRPRLRSPPSPSTTRWPLINLRLLQSTSSLSRRSGCRTTPRRFNNL